jgi:EAL domain-containing protein (putative c-di-GMP-specific phosphodiesterase class I)
VNLSGAEFRAKNLAANLGAILQETGVEPRWLELDLTENLLMNPGAFTMGALQEFRDIGVQLAVDNFGTGFSSLSSLRRLPINALKIDRSFIRDIGSGANHAAMTTAIIELAKSLKQRVVAEGVETREQCDFLRVRGCGEGQGYYFSRPVPAGDCAELLRAGIAATVAN